MLDIRWIREHPELLDRALHRRGGEPLANKIIEIDRHYRHALQKTQELQAARNGLAKEIAFSKQNKTNGKDLFQKGALLREQLEHQEKEAENLKKALNSLLHLLPNIPREDVPEGTDDTSNQEVFRWGTPCTFSFDPLPHEIFGRSLGLDFEAAARISGSRFVILKGAIARLERALANFMLDIHTQRFGYTEVTVPYLVREEAVYGVGQLPKFREDLFQTTDNRWLISTGEVPLTNLVQDQILEEADLPLRFVAYTPCFRSEAGCAGKDMHGMIRQHQFSKVELVHITTPETSEKEHTYLRNAAEEILKLLELPYRAMLLSAGDMGASSQKTYDLEVWLPSQKTYREISSCSLCGDYQARRMNARFRRTGGPLEFVHTLNGSGLAVGRTLVAILENYQQSNGSLLSPPILQPYMGGQTHIEAFEKK
jgi:seryl-tRNA synthetase